jgi:hypothetical protein
MEGSGPQRPGIASWPLFFLKQTSRKHLPSAFALLFTIVPALALLYFSCMSNTARTRPPLSPADLRHDGLAKGARRILLFLPVFLFPASCLIAGVLSDPVVDAYNVRVGTQTFAGLYQFTTNTLLVETAQAITNMGSDIIKMYLGSNYPRQYNYSLAPNITNLMTLARDDASCHHTLDLPFHHIIAWAYPFSNPDAPFGDGSYTATEQANDYREIYDLTRYLLTNYNNSGKTFYLGHWEGDGYLNVNNWSTNPSSAVIQGMIGWQNTRQKAVDDAKAGSGGFTNVKVFYYAEVNRVRDAMLNGPTNNQRAINYVVPYVTNLDFLSYSSYDAMNLATPDLYATLDYIEARLPTNKLSSVPGERVWIGEYGWGGSQTTAQQEPTSRAYIQRLLNYGAKALPHILFWEMYDNETNKLFCLIDSNNVKVASYYLHQRYINNARLLTAQFKESNGRLPTDSEFASLVSPMLNQPLPAPVSLAVSNQGASLLTSSSARVSGSLAQGIYRDDQASVWVFWGRQDGGSLRTAWEHSLLVGLNTNFNPATFTAVLTNLVPQTNYFFRFYATNATGEVWAPGSDLFSTATLNPPDYGSSMKITFAGYTAGEPLSNFPVLVRLGTNVPGFSYRQFASPSGGDLRFTASDGQILIPHELDEWNTNGTSSVWVGVPRLTGPSDYIRAYWGNPLAAAPPFTSTNGAVWKPNYLVVYHLKENGFPYTDSSQQHPALSGVAPVSVLGQIGRGCAFDGKSQFLDAGVLNLGNAFTLSAWVNIANAATNIQTVWANQKGGYTSAGFAWFVNTYLTADQKLDFGSGDGVNGNETTTAAGAVSFGHWHLLSAAVNRTSGTVELFVDGADLGGSGLVVNDFANQADLNLGRFTNANFYFTGIIDEARIQNAVVSSNWLRADWMTVASNAVFSTYSPVTQTLPPLSLTAGANVLLVSWPASGVGFALYSATNLVRAVAWAPVGVSPVLVNGEWQINLPATNSSPTFLRLQFQ